MNTSETTDSPMVGGEWIRRDGDLVALTISRCRSCNSSWFPPREICSTCASDNVEQTVSANHGTAYASTVVRIGPTAFEPPYVLAYVDISGVRVLAHVDADEALVPGARVELRVGKIGSDKNGAFSSYLVAETAGGAR
ncbi:OB-fold domain-containing protein [Saccharopolyspora shandongensis]|uniref:Zn-ribbon domain-containing OB-fold protein n=1 Tax=Saccharopolyspora shandongensis TaxID=418495 RepID=UPI003413C5D2